jgi:hypothetical protein
MAACSRRDICPFVREQRFRSRASSLVLGAVRPRLHWHWLSCIPAWSLTTDLRSRIQSVIRPPERTSRLSAAERGLEAGSSGSICSIGTIRFCRESRLLVQYFSIDMPLDNLIHPPRLSGEGCYGNRQRRISHRLTLLKIQSSISQPVCWFGGRVKFIRLSRS